MKEYFVYKILVNICNPIRIVDESKSFLLALLVDATFDIPAIGAIIV